MHEPPRNYPRSAADWTKHADKMLERWARHEQLLSERESRQTVPMLGTATAAMVVGIISLVIWPIGGVAVLLALIAAPIRSRPPAIVRTRATIGYVCGILSSAVTVGSLTIMLLAGLR